MRLVAAADGGVFVDGARVLERDVRCLLALGGTLSAGTHGDGVWSSADGGAAWSRAGLDGAIVKSLAAGRDLVYAGTKPPRVWARREGAWSPLAPFPRSRSWWWWQPAERLSTPYVCALACAGGALVAGIEAGAVVRSTDGGRTWSGHGRGASRDCHELFATNGRIYEVGGTGPLAWSDDGGVSWRRVRAGAERYGWSASCDTAGRLYLVAAPVRRAHSGDSNARLYRLERARWRSILGPLTRLPRLAAAPGGELVLARGDGTVAVTTDGGETWNRVPFALPPPVRALVALA